MVHCTYSVMSLYKNSTSIYIHVSTYLFIDLFMVAWSLYIESYFVVFISEDKGALVVGTLLFLV